MASFGCPTSGIFEKSVKKSITDRFFCFENQVQAQKKTEKIPLYCLLDAKKAQICIKLSENVISSPFLFLACT